MANKMFGKIYNPRKEVSIEWKIDNYFSLPQKADSYMDSPAFHCLNATWHLRLYPNGSRSLKSVEYPDFYMYLTNKSSETENTHVKFILGIRLGNGETYQRFELSKMFGQNTGYGITKFLKRNELLKNKDEIATDGVLTLFSVVKQSSYVTDASSQTASINRCLFRDFFNLLHNKQKSDVVIKLKERHFQAHKLILGARSSVFAAMFKHETKEYTRREVNLEDFDYDPDAFYEFLLFMYTGQINELSLRNALHLFKIGAKFNVGELKEKCVDFMKDNLTLDNVCDVIATADKHNEVELKDLAKKMIFRNMKALISTKQWITFMRDNSNLAAELLMRVIPDDEDSWVTAATMLMI